MASFSFIVGSACAAVLALVFAITHAPSSDSSATPLGSGQMFDAIAKRYDMINTALSLGMHHMWRTQMVEAVHLKPGDTVLDAGTGTADVAIAVAQYLEKLNGKSLDAEDVVIGVDPSQNMLDVGRDKIAAAGLNAKSVRLVHGDAQDLSGSLPPGMLFDVATMSFAIRNVPDRRKAIQQIADRLRPGGRLAVLELCQPSFLPARLFVKYAVPMIGALMSGGAMREYAHLEKSVLDFDAKAFESVVTGAGLELVEVTSINFGTVTLYVGKKPAAA